MARGLRSPDIVEQRGRAYDGQVRAFCLCNALCGRQHAQDVVKIVPAAARIIQRARRLNRDGCVFHGWRYRFSMCTGSTGSASSKPKMRL